MALDTLSPELGRCNPENIDGMRFDGVSRAAHMKRAAPTASKDIGGRS